MKRAIVVAGLLCLVALTRGQPPAVDVKEAMLRQRDQLQRRSREQFEQMLYDHALKSAKEAVVLTEKLAGPASADLADALRWQVHVHLHRREYREAGPLIDRVLAIRQQVDGARPWLIRDAQVYQRYVKRIQQLTQDEDDRLDKSAHAIYDAQQLNRLGKTAEAIRVADQALATRKAVLGYADGEYLQQFAIQAMRRLDVKAERQTGVQMLEEAIRLQRELHGRLHRDHAATLQGVALVHRRLGQMDKAEPLLREAAEIFETVLGKEHQTSQRALEMLADAQRRLANSAREQSDLPAARQHLLAESQTWERRFHAGHWRMRDAESLLREFEHVFKADAKLREAGGKALSLLEDAQGLRAKGQFRAAIPALDRAAAALEATLPPRHKALQECLWGLAESHHQVGDHDQAEKAFSRCLTMTVAELGEGHPDLIQRLDQLRGWRAEQIDAALQRQDFPGALRWLALLREVDRQRHPGQDWRLKSIDWRAAGVRELAVLSPRNRKRVAEAEEWMKASEEHSNRNNLPEARDWAEKALVVYEELLEETNESRVDALHALGHLQSEMGDFAKAEETMRRVLALKEQMLGKMHSRYAFTMQNLASMYARTGNREKAVEIHEERAAILRRTLGPEHLEYARALTDLAVAFLLVGRVDKADQLLDEALPLLEKSQGPERTVYANALNALASIYGERQRPELAAAFYEKAGAIWKEFGDPIRFAISLDNLGGVQRRLGNLERAAQLHQEAQSLFLKHLKERHPTTAIGFANLAAVQAKQKDWDQAAATQFRALSASRYNVTLATALRSEPQQLDAYRFFRQDLDLYLAYALAAKLPAEQLWEQLLAWKGLTFRQQYHNRLARTAPELAKLVGELRDATTRLAAVAFAMPPESQRDQWQQRLQQRTKERDQAEERLLTAASKRPGGQPFAATPERVRAALPESAVLFDFFVYRDPGSASRLLVFVVRRNQPVMVIDLGPVDAVGKAVDAWRKTINQPDQAPAQEVHGLIGKPLQKHWEGASLVLISPDGPLGRFPFAALPGRAPGSYLVEDLAVAVIPVPHLLPELVEAPAKIDKTIPSLLLVGDIDFAAPPGRIEPLAMPAQSDPSVADVLNRGPAGEKPIDARPQPFKELPGTKVELAKIADVFEKAFQRKIEPGLRRQAATEQHLRGQAPGKEFIHLATHGFFAPSWLRSALRSGDDLDAPVSLADTRFTASRRLTWTHPGLLSGIALTGANRGLTQDRQEGERFDDGIMTAAELAEIDLTGARLVVLSACETGLGDTAGGEGLLGLQRALHVAGARSAVTSLWEVPDHATQALMVEFYMNLWERKMDPLTAFRASQRTIMLHYDPVKRSIFRAKPLGKRLPPYFWAGFVLSGDWR